MPPQRKRGRPAGSTAEHSKLFEMARSTKPANRQGIPPEATNKILFKTGRFSDFTIKCKDWTFHAHKSVLCSQSEFFMACCEGGFKLSSNLFHIPRGSDLMSGNRNLSNQLLHFQRRSQLLSGGFFSTFIRGNMIH